ncbi:MAG: hypothetical protein GX832_02255 [Clostridiales bacterium]|nr:hypothetical protein [Clostridiales bacterium]
MSDQQYGQQPGNYGQQGYYDPQTGQYVQQQYGQQQGYYDPQTGQYYQQQAAYSQQGQYWQQPATSQPQYQHAGASGNAALKVLAVITLLFGIAFLVFYIVTMFTGPRYKDVFKSIGSSFDSSTSLGLYTIAHLLKIITFFVCALLFIGTGISALVGSVRSQKLKTAKSFAAAATVAQVFAFIFSLAVLLLALFGTLTSFFGDSIKIWTAYEGTPMRTYIIVELAALALLGLIFILILKSVLKKAKASGTTAQQQPYYGSQYYQQPQTYGAQQQYYDPQTQYTGQTYQGSETGYYPDNQQ